LAWKEIRVSQRQTTCVLALAAVALLVAAPLKADDRPSKVPYDTPGPVPALDPSYRMESHKVVLITDQDLRPSRVFLKKGQLVAWVSYAPQPSVIVFERELARNMICHSLVNFKIQEDELRSAPIHAGEFASFCELKPGRYRYKVVRPDPGQGAAGSRKRLEGEIIVAEPEPDDG